jgi:hypothetical protein
MTGVRVAATGVLTAWGEGLTALPEDARAAAGGRRVMPLRMAAPPGERFRRATRECRLGVAAVEALCREGVLARERLAGGDTALVYVTAAAYGASNRGFVEAAAGGALHFPYTAPSAVPAEVAIEYGLTGRYAIFVGGATATIDALWHAARLVGTGVCARALVLAVETFAECADLWQRARWVVGLPLVEGAACVVLEPASGRPAPAVVAARWSDEARRRSGEMLACEPLVALALAAAAGEETVAVSGVWRGDRATIAWR